MKVNTATQACADESGFFIALKPSEVVPSIPRGWWRSGHFVFGQQVIHVAGAGVADMRVFEVEIVVARLDLVDGDAPGLFVFRAMVPPSPFRLKLLDTDGFTLVVGLGAIRIRVLVIPDCRCGLSLGEEEKNRRSHGSGIRQGSRPRCRLPPCRRRADS